jgi:O-antigen/teichoic acid export membrane protein
LNGTTKSTRLVVISAWTTRIISALAMLYSLRVLSETLSPPEYAAFIILIGLIGWFALTDFGIGYAVQNAISRRLANGEIVSPEIITAYFILLMTTVAVVLALFIFQGPLANLLLSKISEDGAILNKNTFFVVTSLLAVGGIATISTKILYAMHRGYVANIASALGSVVGVGVLMIGVDSAPDKILFAVLALYGPTVLISLAFCGHQISQTFKSRISINSSIAINLINSAKGFFAFYFVAASVLQVDYLIMSQKIEPHEIVQYYIIAKIFVFVSFINQAVLFAAWPQMTAIYATGERAELTRIIRKLVVASMLTTLTATIVVLSLRVPLGDFLAPGSAIEFRFTVILGFGAIALLRCITDPFAIFLQSIDQTKPLILFASAQAVIGGTLQWLLAEDLGIEGILLALALSFILTVAWGLPLTTNRILRQS